MKRRTIRFIEPITRVKWQKLHFGTLGQVRWLVDDQPSAANACLDGHEMRVSLQEPPQQAFAADAARCDGEAGAAEAQRWTPPVESPLPARLRVPILILVELRFYVDPAAGQPHIWNHDVEESEVKEVLANPAEDRPAPVWGCIGGLRVHG
ncbi:MAG: hypothetical protein FJW37_00965 [Acidobacteria bacterium]|nr:hypothetical protein [Acidobacteriota bacterium]